MLRAFFIHDEKTLGIISSMLINPTMHRSNVESMLYNVDGTEYT